MRHFSLDIAAARAHYDARKNVDVHREPNEEDLGIWVSHAFF